MRAPRQAAFFCACGAPRLHARGRCLRCYDQRRRSLRLFNGRREQILARDRHLCTNCGGAPVVVHHRSRTDFATLCLACHARVHHIRRLRVGRLTPYLERLWREQHRAQADQLLLPGFAPEEPAGEQTLLFAA